MSIKSVSGFSYVIDFACLTKEPVCIVEGCRKRSAIIKSMTTFKSDQRPPCSLKESILSTLVRYDATWSTSIAVGLMTAMGSTALCILPQYTRASFWVMLADNDGFVLLPGERILYSSPPRTTLSLQSQSSYPGTEPVSISSSGGCAHLTNQRIVYLPASPTPSLLSFSAPILNLHDTHVSAPFFGPNVWRAALQPVPGGGLPPTRSLIELKMVFKDGGAFDFHSNFERIKERLQQALDVAREAGQIVGDGADTGGGQGSGALTGINMAALDLEQLPAYEEARETTPVTVVPVIVPAAVRSDDQPHRDSSATVSSEEETVRRPDTPETAVETVASPVEPPPGYEEVQRSSVANELERTLLAQQ
ncbi:MAG: hypothetical protein M1816_001714 [Peltula sp. TS41687]|nr:MAG: hypothetical protein M1816_001714 [Peltula sp. TS41687]